MSNDCEVLRKGGVLCNYLVNTGYVEFESFDNKHVENERSKSSFNQEIDSELNLQKVSYHNHKNVIKILHSKLLLVEDAQLIEGLLQTYSVSNPPRYKLFFGLITASFFIVTSVGFTFFKINGKMFAPLSLTSALSLFIAWQLRKEIIEIRNSNKIECYIKSFQSLSINIHKLLCFIKETEILSTGQVSTNNIGATMYIVPVIKEFDKFPSWKVLPHMRKCLSDSLQDSINILFEASDKTRDLLPEWMKIEGYTFSNQIVLREKLLSVENTIMEDKSISIKNLHVLSSLYLILQSEYLRWIAILLSSPDNCAAKSLETKRRLEVFELISETHLKLTNISFKLKFDLKQLDGITRKDFTGSLDITSHEISLNRLQVEVHNIELLVLSILLKVRDLEEELDEFNQNSELVCSDLIKLKDIASKQLHNVREDLESVVKKYNEMLNLFVLKKQQEVKSDNTFIDYFSASVQPNLTSTIIRPNSEPNLMSTLDEVFIGKSSLKSHGEDHCFDEWDIETKPLIPKTLLSELADTLKPIKEDFKERERKALERSGVQDIENIEENEELILRCKSQMSCSSKLRSDSQSEEDNYFTKSNMSKGNINKYKPNNSSEDLKYDIKSLSNQLQSQSGNEDHQIPVFSSSSLAKIVAMKSKEWGKSSEECYSDDS